MAAGTIYQGEEETEFSPLHYGEQQEAGRRPGHWRPPVRRRRRGGIFRFIKKLAAPFAKIALGAIPGVGGLASSVVGALTREQQEHLEAALHEIASGEYAGHELHEAGEFGEYAGHELHEAGEFGEYAGHELHEAGEFGHESGVLPESILGEYSGEATHELSGMPEFAQEAGLHEFAGEYPEAGLHEAGLHPEYELGVGHSEVSHGEAALMEQIAHEAAISHHEIAAEALVGSLVPLATASQRRIAPRTSGPALRRAVPPLVVATGRLAHSMRRSPATRPLVRVLPVVLNKTARAIAATSAQGKPITPQRAVRMMAAQTYRTFNSPEVVISILVRAGRRRRQQRRYPG